MSFFLYFFCVNKDMITHRRAAHQSAEMDPRAGTARAWQALGMRKQTHRHKPASQNPLSLTPTQTRISSPKAHRANPVWKSCSCEQHWLWRVQDSPPRRYWGLFKGWWRTAESLMLWPDPPSCAPGGVGAALSGKARLSTLLKKSTRSTEAKIPTSDYFLRLSGSQDSLLHS